MNTKVTEALADHGFFAGLGMEELTRIAACGDFRTFAAGTQLAQEGEAATTFYALLDGRIAILTNVPNRDPVVLQTLERGAVVGWSWLDELEWVFSVRAVTDCTAVALEASCLRPLLEERPTLGMELMRRLLKVMTQRLKAARLQLMDIYGRLDDA